MSMTTWVTGFRPPDDKWAQMKVIYDACGAAGVPVPDEVEDFFDWEPPDDAGVEVKVPFFESTVDMETRYEVQVSDIPAGITTLRFVNSW